MNIFKINLPKEYKNPRLYFNNAKLVLGRSYKVHHMGKSGIGWKWDIGTILLFKKHISPATNTESILFLTYGNYIDSKDMEMYKLILEDV